MKILLINPPCGDRTIGLKNIAAIEPLALELVGAGVSGDHDVRLVDMMIRPGDLQETLAGFTPDIAGVTSEIVHVETALAALKTVRAAAPRCLTVVGGHHATLWPEDFDDPAVDLVVIGEGVETFAEICAAHGNGVQGFSHIPGLRIRTATGRESTPPRPLPASLDDQPFPDRALTARYRKHYYYLFEREVAAIRTSVGCSFPCSFCSCRIYSRGAFIPRSPEKVFEEIRSLDEEFVMFCDDHSFHDPERMRRLARLLIEGGVRKRYFAYARADSIVENREVFALWARAGLTLVMTGLEAVDEAALQRTGKRTSVRQNEEALRILERLGIQLSAGFLITPDFADEDFRTIDRYIRNHPSILLAEFTPLTPFPGTPLHRRLRGSLVTQDRQLFDLQHFVVKTELSSRRLYRLMLRSYRAIVLRVVRRLRLWRPGVLFSPHVLRVLRGLYRNHVAFKKAHLVVESGPAREATPPARGNAS